MFVLILWAKDTPVTDVIDDAEIDSRTGVDMYQWLREVCSTKLLQSPIILGGPGVIVQVDESLFRHKPKASEYLASCIEQKLENCVHLQNNRGRRPHDPIWVFRLVDTSHTPGLGYMEIVQQRDAATLLPIINSHVAPGTVIHTDEWAAYNRVSSLPNVSSHSRINHSVTFVDPVTGTHTQTVESYWNRCKTKLKRMKGCVAHQVPSYLDEFMWRERHGTS